MNYFIISNCPIRRNHHHNNNNKKLPILIITKFQHFSYLRQPGMTTPSSSHAEATTTNP